MHVSPIVRRISRQIMVGNVPVGGGAPISIQSMTNTETCDVEATVRQVQALADAGADIVRVSVPSMEAAEAFRLIRQRSPVPLVSDIHFDYKIALAAAAATPPVGERLVGARWLGRGLVAARLGG